MLASAEVVDALTDRLVGTLCPDADHDGPCPIPWALRVTDGKSLSKAKQRRYLEEIATTNP